MSNIFERYSPFIQEFIYKNNWEELKKWLSYEWYEVGNDINCGEILNKMKEFEEDK